MSLFEFGDVDCDDLLPQPRHLPLRLPSAPFNRGNEMGAQDAGALTASRVSTPSAGPGLMPLPAGDQGMAPLGHTLMPGQPAAFGRERITHVPRQPFTPTLGGVPQREGGFQGKTDKRPLS